MVVMRYIKNIIALFLHNLYGLNCEDGYDD